MSIQEVSQEFNKGLQLFAPISQASPIEMLEEKYEKHRKNSEPILANFLTPYEAFKEGFEKAIASYIKLGQEGHVKNKVISECQPKSEETLLLEQLIKSLLRDFDSVRFIKKEDRYLALCQGQLYQFSTLLERVNFNQIELTNEELTAYHQLLDTGRLLQKPSLPYCEGRPTEQDFIHADPENLCQALTLAEKEAINIYTGHFYYPMNNLMRGNIDVAIDSYPCDLPEFLTRSAKTNQSLKEILLHVTVAVSALNKLPDYTPPPGLDGQPQKYLYRAETFLPEDVLQKRKWAVLQGGGITTEMGFLSTAFNKPAAGFFSEYTTSGILIKNLKGKKVTPLSQFGEGEREILLPPTQMQWLYQKDIITDIFQNHLTLFIAKPVTVAPELTIDYKPCLEEWMVKVLNEEDKNLFETETIVV